MERSASIVMTMGMPPRVIGRILVVDAALAIAVGVLIMTGAGFAAASEVPPRLALDTVAYGFMILAAGMLTLRRIWPLGTMAVVVGAVAVYLTLGYPHGPLMSTVAISMYGVAAKETPRRSLIAGSVGLAALITPEIIWMGGQGSAAQLIWPITTVAGLLLLVPWAFAMVVRISRESRVKSQEEEARRKADEERLRIAREIHDVLGHGLAVINMQAGVTLHVLDRHPEHARPALEAIRATSKRALDELRVTLAVFRGDEDEQAPRRPLAGLDEIDALLADMRVSGLSADLTVTGDRVELPQAVNLAAYRIVQESLTNVLRHGGGARAAVSIGYKPDALVIEICDTGTRPPAAARRQAHGHGIIGMRERAAGVGGTLTAGWRSGGGFGVRANLPLKGGVDDTTGSR